MSAPPPLSPPPALAAEVLHAEVGVVYLIDRNRNDLCGFCRGPNGEHLKFRRALTVRAMLAGQ